MPDDTRRANDSDSLPQAPDSAAPTSPPEVERQPSSNAPLETVPPSARMTAAPSQAGSFEPTLQSQAIDTIPFVAAAFATDLPRDLGEYRLIRSLGKGAMGIVYEAIDRRNGARVALKTINPAVVRSIAAFKQEFRSLAEITHPNLVAFGELVTQDTAQPFFTMELVEGSPFTEFVRPGIGAGGRVGGPRQAPPGECQPARLRQSLSQLVEGLSALHEAGKLHRDIKPSNVLAADGGRIVILDFGLAVELEGDEFRNRQKEIAGTFYYMSPEQHAAGSLSPASDWFSVGVMLYESLTGQLPFSGALDEIRKQKAAGEFLSPGELDSAAPEDLCTLCVELLAPAPQRRPTGAEIISRLQGVAVRSRIQAPWVGREREMERLQDAFQTVRQGRPLTVLVHGESGMGKTALVQRFLSWLRDQPDAVVLRGRCYENESVPYKAFDGLIDSLADHLRGIPREELSPLLPGGASSLCRVFPVLRDCLLHAPSFDVEAPVWDPQEVRRQGFAALRELLANLSRRSPLVLFMDDVQWGDSDSAKLYAELVRGPDPPSVLWLCAYRSEDASRSQFLRQIHDSAADEFRRCAVEEQEVHVGPLLPADARRLARDLLQGRFESSIDSIVAEADGSPLFLQVLAQRLTFAASESGATDRADESPLVGRSQPTLTLDDVLWEQIGRLSDQQQAMLESVAVAGQPLPRRVLHRAAGMSRGDLLAYNELRHRHFLKGVGAEDDALTDSAPVEAYHDRIRETVARRLSEEKLAERSRRLAEALEAETVKSDARLLARLHLRGGDRFRAGEYYMQAGHEAQSSLAFARAASCFRDALEALRPSGMAEAGLRQSLADSLANAGRTAEAAEEYSRAAQCADSDKAAELRCRAALRYLTSGHVDQGLAVLEQVLAAEGMRLPASPAIAVVSLLWRRWRLWRRGLAFRPCLPEEADPADLRLLDVTWAAAAGLSMVDPLRAADFVSRYLLLSLEIGEPNAILRGLNVQIGHLAIGGSKDRPVVSRYLRKIREAARLAPGPRAAAARELSRGVAAHLRGEWKAARRSCDRAARYLLDKRCQDVAWDLDTAQTFSMWALTYSGEAAEATRRHPDLLQRAREHNDLYAILNFGTTVAAFAQLAEDQPGELRRHLRDDANRLSERGFFVQHHNWLLATTFLELYEGQGVQAWRAIGDRWPRYRASFLNRVQQIRIDFVQTHARAALAAAAHSPATRSFLRQAARDARKLESEKAAWATALAHLVRASLRSLEGDTLAAVQRLDAAVDALQRVDMKLFAEAARYRKGQLLDDAAGRQLVEDAKLRMRTLGVRAPERMACALAPGFLLFNNAASPSMADAALPPHSSRKPAR